MTARLGVSTPANHDLFGELELPHGLFIPAAPLDRTCTLAAVDVGDPAMPERDAVLDHEQRTRRIIGGDAVDRCRARGPAHHHHRRLPARLHHLRALHHRRTQDEAVDPELQQGFDRLVFVLLDPVSRVHQHAVAQSAGAGLDSGNDVDEEGIVEIGNQDAHDAGPFLHETLGHRIRAIPEFSHRAQRRRPPFRAHVTVATDDQGHEGLGNTRAPRHVIDCRSSSALHA